MQYSAGAAGIEIGEKKVLQLGQRPRRHRPDGLPLRVPLAHHGQRLHGAGGGCQHRAGGAHDGVIYCGQELGERGMDEEGFSGRDGRTMIFDYWSLELFI